MQVFFPSFAQDGGNASLLNEIRRLDAQSPKTAFDTLYHRFEANRQELSVGGEADVWYEWGNYFVRVYQIDSAISHFMAAQGFYEQAKDSLGLAWTWFQLAGIDRHIDNRTQALERMHAALNVFERMEDTLGISRSMLYLANDYNYLGEHEIARVYYDESYHFHQLLGDTSSMSRTKGNIGGMFEEDGNIDSALYYTTIGLELARKSKDTIELIRVYQGMSIIYRSAKQFDKEYGFLQQSLALSRQVNDPLSIGFSLQGFALHFIDLKNYDSAEWYAHQSLDMAKQMKNAQLTVNSYGILSDTYLQKRNFEKAFYYQKLDRQESDSLFNLKNANITKSMNSRYQVERREKEIALRNLEISRIDAQLTHQTNLRNILLLGLFVVMIFLIVIYRNNRQRQKAFELLKEKNHEIRRQRDLIKASDEIKSRWFINVSHELRTPLTLILGPVERILEKEKLNPIVENDLAMVARNARQLTSLVNEILDLSKMEEGKLTLHEKPVNISQLIRQNAAFFESVASRAGIHLNTAIEADVFMLVDPEKIAKIIINLISNALKFTPYGGTVSVSAECKNEFCIRVRDTGEGIGKDDLPYVFDRFYQSAKREKQGGTGLGLALSKELAELHGGMIRVESQLGIGSEFIVTLPVSRQVLPEDAPDEEVAEPEEVDQGEGAFQNLYSEKPLMLLVEDNVDMRQYILSICKNSFTVHEVENGLEALDFLGKRRPDLIISDVMMPKMNGYEFAKQVKNSPEWMNIPFITLTAIASEDEKVNILRIGIDDYLIKPFHPDELLVRAQNLIFNARQRESLDPKPDEDDEVSFDSQVLKRLETEVKENIANSEYNVLQLAHAMAVSERQLYRLLRRLTGLTPAQFIREIRMQKAMELIEQRIYPTASQVAYAVGYPNPSHFYTSFKKRFGKQPGTYL